MEKDDLSHGGSLSWCWKLEWILDSSKSRVQVTSKILRKTRQLPWVEDVWKLCKAVISRSPETPLPWSYDRIYPFGSDGRSGCDSQAISLDILFPITLPSLFISLLLSLLVVVVLRQCIPRLALTQCPLPHPRSPGIMHVTFFFLMNQFYNINLRKVGLKGV